MGWSEGKDWALATRLAGEALCCGRNEELGCWEKETERGLAVAVFGATFPEAGVAAVTSGHGQGQGIRPN